MLKHSLFELALATVLSSEKFADLLCQKLIESDERGKTLLNATFQKECIDVLKKSLDVEYPRQFRLDDIELAFQQVFSPSIFKTGEVPFVKYLFEEMLTISDKYIHYRNVEVERYVRFTAKLDPTILVGWYLAQKIHTDDSLTVTDLKAIVDIQEPLFSSEPDHETSYTEGHIHLNGVFFDGVSLIHQLTQNDKLDDFNNLTKLSQALLTDIPENFQINEDINQTLKRIWNTTIGNSQGVTLLRKYNFSYIASINVNEEVINSSWLKKQMAITIVDEDYTKAWLWFVIWLWERYQNNATHWQVRIAIFYLLIRLMYQRSKIIMDGQGLTRFIDTNHESLRKSTKSKAQEISAVKKIFQGKNDNAEIKITHQGYTPQAIAKFADTIFTKQKKVVSDSLSTNPKKYSKYKVEQMARLHFCIHFLRTKESKRKRQKIWKEGKNLKSKLEYTSGWQNLEVFDNIIKNNYKFEPEKWIRGLDVAGNENSVKTELFAPMIRWLINAPIAGSNQKLEQHGFHLSIHAGEDYAHPISGMRNIDETVKFCDMKSGDRLGHALAIGINPANWVNRQGDIFLPVEEHLDNLVWIWHYAEKLKGRVDSATSIITSLENRIVQFSKHVPWTSYAYMQPFYNSGNKATTLSEIQIAENPGVEPRILYDAWLLRKNCFYQFEQYDSVTGCDDLIKFAVPDLKKLLRFDWTKRKASGGIDISPERLFLQRSELMRDSTNNGKGRIVHLHTNIRKKVMRPFDDFTNGVGMLEDYQSSDELEFLYALQDYLIDEYANLGIVIETNPSSNLYISRLDSYSEHPIFRWNPPDSYQFSVGEEFNKFGLRTKKINVTINTDDPGIMPTTLRTEYELLIDAAIDKGISESDAHLWANNIRKFSNKLFKDVHKPVFTLN